MNNYYLLLDSSNAVLSVGITNKKQMIAKISYPCFQRQSEYMIVEIDKLLKSKNIDIKEIIGVMVAIGPGSYTGIRIALTIAKVMALALNIPIYPVSTLEINKVYGSDSIVLFNARSNRSYIAAFHNNKRILDDQIMYNHEVLSYIKQHAQYHLIGDLSYLNLNGEKVDVLDNMMLMFDDIKPVNNPNLIKPIYLKENYL